MSSSKDSLKVIKTYIVDKVDSLKDRLDILCAILPQSIEFGGCYSTPESEKERNELINYIINFINRVNIDTNSIISFAYSQMESLLTDKISEMKCYNEYKAYKNNDNKKSELQSRFDFIVSKKNYTLNDLDKEIIKDVLNTLRKTRNDISHKSYTPFTFEDAVNTLRDVVNLDCELQAYLNSSIEFINRIYIIWVYYFELCDKMCA